MSSVHHRSLQNVVCPARHELWQMKTADRGVSVNCDVCSSRVREDAVIASCTECDFDLCASCWNVSQSQIDNSAARWQLEYNNRAPRIQACCMLAIARSADPITAAARGQRYNERRPDYRGQRVSTYGYPDPSNFGWTFTGSCEGGRAEFFEKDFAVHGVVKLDFYYTTGTIKTVLDHPLQGVTQLFAKGDSLSPEMYRAILQNPRQHTGNRYHRRPDL
jgi:hypothetical protein